MHALPDFEADYVIVGAGAVGMAFADTLLEESDASMILVERRARPGGHWNDAYPFIRLHAPSELYGVNSAPLGSGRRDATGLNRGLLELASGSEILAYFERLLHERLLASGRVRFLASTEYRDGGVAVSRLDGRTRRVSARRRLVDATLAETRVPATHPPSFPVATGVQCEAPGALARLERPYESFVVIGAGKTAIDAALWLLEHDVDPDAITWIRPREPWLLDRAHFQTDDEGFAGTVGALAAEMEVASSASGIDGLFDTLEARGLLHRIDRGVWPTMYRCAIVSRAELDALRRIRNVVRLGHVRAIEPGRIVLAGGTLASSADTLHINCTADGIPRSTPQPVFRDGRINLQYVRRCSPTFSAALIAHLEASGVDDSSGNELCGIVPVPQVPRDWLRMAVQDAQNAMRWNREPALRQWLSGARLNPIARMIERVMAEPTPERVALFERYRRAVGPGVSRLAKLLEAR